MDENELQRLEARLESIRPAPPPAGFLRRLKSETPALVAERRAHTPAATPSAQARDIDAPVPVSGLDPVRCWAWVPSLVRLLLPATALVVVGAIIWRANLPAKPAPESRLTPVRADHVRIDQQLVSSFDTVAPLPSGEPVRFRCREWMDEVMLRDSRRGVEVTRRVPRVEVVPVRFETY